MISDRKEPIECHTCGKYIRDMTVAEKAHCIREPYEFVIDCKRCILDREKELEKEDAPIIFLGGSIGIKTLDDSVKARVNNIVDSGLWVVVGDADGADSAFQSYLAHIEYENVSVFRSGYVRNLYGPWATVYVESENAAGARGFHTAKDIAMAELANFGLMVWNGKSTGTLSNVVELLARGKKSVVYYDKFYTVGTAEQLEQLVGTMDEQGRSKAETKIGLTDRIKSLKQGKLFK